MNVLAVLQIRLNQFNLAHWENYWGVIGILAFGPSIQGNNHIRRNNW